MTIRSYRDLKVWEKAVDFGIESYRLTKLLPKEAKRMAYYTQRHK